LLSGIRRLLKQRAGAPGEQHVGDMADDVDSLKEKVSQGKLPVHVGIIMDGNGRWAKRRGLPRLSGHAAGGRKAEEIVKFAQDVGIKHITLYVFSTENWRRPKDEVDGLMNLLVAMSWKISNLSISGPSPWIPYTYSFQNNVYEWERQIFVLSLSFYQSHCLSPCSCILSEKASHSRSHRVTSGLVYSPHRHT
jgi:hypothetical protein